MKKLVCLLMTVFLFSCASVHPGKYGKRVDEAGNISREGDDRIVISGDTDKSLSNDYYKFMVFTFEDKGGKPVDISDVKLSFGDKRYESEVKAVTGKELDQWYDAQLAEKKRKEKNRSTLFGTTAIAGGLLSFLDGSIGNAGTALLAGGAASMGIDGLHKGNRDAERGSVLPETHLLSGEFKVPAGLYERRWIVLNVGDEREMPREVFLSYRDNGAEEKVVIPLKW